MDINYSETIWFNDGSSSLFKKGKLELSDGNLQLLKGDNVVFSEQAAQVNATDIDSAWHSVWAISVNNTVYKVAFYRTLLYSDSKALQFVPGSLLIFGRPGLIQLRHRDNLCELLRPYNPIGLPVPPGQNGVNSSS
jgi:hypothetical protein